MRKAGRWGFAPATAIVAVLVVAALAAVAWVQAGGPHPGTTTGPPAGPCKGTARCFIGPVTHIVDGDTLDVDGVRIRLTLVDAPESGQPGYPEAKGFTAATCPLGSQALVDEDDGQTGGSYGRIVAVVTCGGVNLNAALLASWNAVILTQFCSVSEFANEPWATACH
jgi:endonuclease YncB( thermonuclease family)